MLELSCTLLSVLIIVLIITGYVRWQRLVRQQHPFKVKEMPNIIVPILTWSLYILVLSFTDVLKAYDMPPRFPLFVFLPLFILTYILYSRHKDNETFLLLPLKWTAYVQSFRIFVELILYYTFIKGIIPKRATFEGLNFDILMGITALFVGYFLVSNLERHKTALITWNIVGIIMILIVGSTIGTSVYAPQFWGDTEPKVLLDFVAFPYLFIAGILAPAAIFFHVVSLIQIRVQSRKVV